MSLLLLDTFIIALGSWLTKQVVNYPMLLLLRVKYICLRRVDMSSTEIMLMVLVSLFSVQKTQVDRGGRCESPVLQVNEEE